MFDHPSVWTKTARLPQSKPLRADLQVDAAIIGGGMAGVLCAYFLKASGLRVALLEAGRIGSGQTRNTTAKITSQHGMCYDALIKTHGAQKAAQYAKANEQAIAAYRELIEQQRIDCAFEPRSALLYSQTADPAALRDEAQAAADSGAPARFMPDCPLPFPITGAVYFEGQAQFHPLRFLGALAQALDVYENTRVLSVEGDVLTTAHGLVRAKHIVFCTHFPFPRLPGLYFARMHQERSYVLALENAFLPDAMLYGVDADGLSFREAQGLLLLGGEQHRCGENSGGGRYERLLSRARTLFPDCREVARWSAQDCITLDGVPYIGPFSASQPNWYVATGFAKWGMSTSMAAALLLRGMLLGETPDWADVFSPQRFTLSASAQSLLTDTAQAFKGLTREVFSLPETLAQDLPAGHGGIVETNGEKVGVYKEENGRMHTVKPRCPHLGCQLEWNPDEKSWDCPCHGSRFSYDGQPLCGPAQTQL